MKNPNHTNIIEMLGRNHLIAQLIEDDVHAAVPLWDQGVDLIAYYANAEGLIARPLQLKVAETSRWGVHQKYADVQGLLMVYIWHVKANVEIYAMSYSEALHHLTISGNYVETDSWKTKGGYTIAPIRNRLWESLQSFRMTQGKWRERLERTSCSST